MKKSMKHISAMLLAMCAGGMALAQLPASASKQSGSTITVNVDSVDSNVGYVQITVMTENFEPFDYQMRPAKPGRMTFEMRRPNDGLTFSIMAVQDVNMNHRLDLNEHGIPREKSVVKHLFGQETEATLKLVYYDQILKPEQQPDSAAVAQ